jgi:hypothetical protein
MPATETKSALELLRGLARGLSADVVGGPVDMAESVVNAALMGGGTLGHKLGLLRADQLPEPLSGSVGGSDWFAKNTPLAGSGPEYDSGRLLPMVAGLARGAQLGRGAPKPSPALPEAQRGQLRIGGDPRLMPSHEAESERFLDLLGPDESRLPELYSPSIGVTKDELMHHFAGDMHLIPRIGAFDPAAYPTTLFNRDAYTTRHGGFEGKSVSHTPKLRPISELSNSGAPDPRILNFAKLEVMPGKNDFYTDPALRTLQRAQKDGSLIDFFHRQDSGDLPEKFEYWEIADLPDGIREIANALSVLRSSPRNFGVPDAGAKQKAASFRLADRFLDPASLRNKESKTGVGPAGLHGMAIRSSPAFRSFEQYEKSPLGAKLLSKDDAGAHQHAAEDQLWKAVPEARSYPREMYNDSGLADMLAHRRAMDRHFETGEPIDQAKYLREISQHLGRFRRDVAASPSEYAEIKAVGPVPVTPDSFAGAIFHNQATLAEEMTDSQRTVMNALKDRGLQVDQLDVTSTFTPKRVLFEIADRMQQQAGPSRRHPLK